tara:strand:+ start:4535 stop:5746 length:1212 start_codon:yes stop_codon:yes gene_type:complete
MKCRFSGKDIPRIITFGQMPLGNGFLKEQNPKEEYFYEMSVSVNSEIGLLQLEEQPDPTQMFHENYAFYSRSSSFMKLHFKEMAEEIKSLLQNKFSNDKNPFVVEIGSNDGVMLEHLVVNDIPCLGVEPSKNVAEISHEYGVETINEFMSEITANNILASYSEANVIYSANVFCHIPDLNDLAKACSVLLKDGGYLVFEDPYLADILEKISYDQIYDEHVYLFSCFAVKNIFGKYGLRLVDCKHLNTHGGSMRYYLRKSSSAEESDQLKKQLEYEEKLGVLSMPSYKEFSDKCEIAKKGFKSKLESLKEDKKTILGYGATSKSTTILNYCEVGPELIDFIVDTTPTKQNTFTPGKHIPVLPYAKFSPHPDVSVLFAWNHQKEIMAKEEQYKGEWMTHLYKEYQ